MDVKIATKSYYLYKLPRSPSTRYVLRGNQANFSPYNVVTMVLYIYIFLFFATTIVVVVGSTTICSKNGFLLAVYSGYPFQLPQQYFVDDDAWLQFKFIVLLLLVNVSIVPGKIPIIFERKIPKVYIPMYLISLVAITVFNF